MPTRAGTLRATVAALACGLGLAAALPLSGAGAQAGPYDPPDTIAPSVAITKAPRSQLRTRKKRRKVRFEFVSDDPAATFTCRLDGGSFYPCSSPVTRRLQSGGGKGRRHVFVVRSADPLGNSSGEAVRSLRVERKRGSRRGRG